MLTEKEKTELAESIISLVMANEEFELEERLFNGFPIQSLELLNMCRKFFGMEPLTQSELRLVD